MDGAEEPPPLESGNKAAARAAVAALGARIALTFPAVATAEDPPAAEAAAVVAGLAAEGRPAACLCCARAAATVCAFWTPDRGERAK